MWITSVQTGRERLKIYAGKGTARERAATKANLDGCLIGRHVGLMFMGSRQRTKASI
jgi:hypothetical protein